MKATARFGKTVFIIETPAAVSRDEVARFSEEVLRTAANRARLEGRALRAAEALQALKRALSARWSNTTVNMEAN